MKWRNHNKYEQTEYDTLIVAAGAGQSYFGNDHFAVFAPGMKTIDDALELRAFSAPSSWPRSRPIRLRSTSS